MVVAVETCVTTLRHYATGVEGSLQSPTDIGLPQFPFNLRWFGLNKRRFKFVRVELPENISDYEQLGDFPLRHEPFQELAKTLGKSVEVFRENGDGGNYHVFTSPNPSGEITQAVTT